MNIKACNQLKVNYLLIVCNPTVSFLIDHNNQPHQYCLAVYYLPQGFIPEVMPHGNSKSDRKPFYPTLPSTMEQMKEECIKGSGPKKVVSDVSSRLGGVLAASDSCEIPRNEQQVLKLKKRMCSSELPYDGSDELAIVMHEALMESKSEQFVREVKCLREPAIIVATERQLNDLVRFCTVPGNSSIVTVDPTFSLGDFDVTLVTYRHRLLTSKQSNQHPAMVGPVMIHYRKTFSTYLFFASSLLGMRRELASLKCFGTDGEQALVEAFQCQFSSSDHLTCSIHVRKNTKAKLQELGIAERPKYTILNDLFGKKEGSHYTEGLVDSSSDTMYDAVFDTLVENWKKLDVSESSLQKFVEWFTAYKSHVLKNSMLKSVRQRCGLGSPPVAFTTNASESVNALLKKKVDYKRSELPQFLHHLKALIDEQEQEIQKSVVNRGKYTLLPEYKKFQKSENDWFLKMNETDRTRHLQRFASFKLNSLCLPSAEQKNGCYSSMSTGCVEPESSTSPMSLQMPVSFDIPCTSSSSQTEVAPPTKRLRRQLFTSQQLSVEVSDFKDQVSIPELVLEGVWKKASSLLKSTNAIAKAPGSDEKAHSVISYSGNTPHMVTLKKNGQYVCDKSCANWNSLRICSHTVAVAELNSDLPQFVSWLIKAKKRPSLTKLVVTNMPDGRGKKGGKHVLKKKKAGPILSTTPVTALLSSPSTSQQLSGPSCPPPLLQVTIQEKTSHKKAVYDPPITAPDVVGNAHTVPSCPPPLVHVTPQTSCTLQAEPFELSFITGNISVCYGCRQKYVKPCSPPNDLCVRHKEWREYFPPGSATSQLRYANCYYHCNIQAKCPYFQGHMLKIPAIVAVQLSPIHTQHLVQNMDFDS